MTINLTSGINAVRSTATPTSRAWPAPEPATASTGAADRLTLSPEALALQAAEGKAWRFPPENAPAGVHDAWAEATRNLSDMDRLVAEGAFMAEEISANLKYDAAGQVVGFRQRGEPGYTDLWQQPGQSYTAQVDLMLEKLEQNRGAYEAGDYAFFHDTLAGFRAALPRHGAG